MRALPSAGNTLRFTAGNTLRFTAGNTLRFRGKFQYIFQTKFCPSVCPRYALGMPSFNNSVLYSSYWAIKAFGELLILKWSHCEYYILSYFGSTCFHEDCKF